MISPIENRRIALVGGAGFIGHNLALTLKALGADVHLVDSLQVNNLYAFNRAAEDSTNRDLYIDITKDRLDLLSAAGIPMHMQDARDYASLTNVLASIKPQVVVQLAAIAHANRSNKDPYSTFDHSLRTLENALDFSRGNVEHFIFFSSSMVYGNFMGDSVAEDSPCDPLGIYGALKFAGEKMVIAYNQVFDLPYTIIRPSALYGERCVSRRVGQIFIENAIHGQEVVVMGDGSDSLDFTYIGDLVDGIVKCIENDNSRNEIFNLTYGGARSIDNMASIIKDHFPDVVVRYEDREALMPERGTLQVDKAKSLIGYEPQWPLEVGFVKYIEWYKDHFAKKVS